MCDCVSIYSSLLLDSDNCGLLPSHMLMGTGAVSSEWPLEMRLLQTLSASLSDAFCFPFSVVSRTNWLMYRKLTFKGRILSS